MGFLRRVPIRGPPVKRRARDRVREERERKRRRREEAAARDGAATAAKAAKAAAAEVRQAARAAARAATTCSAAVVRQPRRLEEIVDNRGGAERAAAFAINFPPKACARGAYGLLLWGPPACGKTTVARLVMRLGGFEPCHGDDLLSEARGLRVTPGEALRRRLGRGRRTAVFLDDLFEVDGPSAATALAAVLLANDARVMRRALVVVTSESRYHGAAARQLLGRLAHVRLYSPRPPALAAFARRLGATPAKATEVARSCGGDLRRLVATVRCNERPATRDVFVRSPFEATRALFRGTTAADRQLALAAVRGGELADFAGANYPNQYGDDLEAAAQAAAALSEFDVGSRRWNGAGELLVRAVGQLTPRCGRMEDRLCAPRRTLGRSSDLSRPTWRRVGYKLGALGGGPWTAAAHEVVDMALLWTDVVLPSACGGSGFGHRESVRAAGLAADELRALQTMSKARKSMRRLMR